MTARRFGWRPELLQPDRRLAWSRSSLRLRGTIPTRHSLVADLDMTGDGVLDQGGTSSCVAHAVAGAVRLRAAYADTVLGLARTRLDAYALPSRRWLYRLARETHGDGAIDDGTYISAAIYVARTLGWPHERHVPWDESRINDAMSADARHHAHDQRDAVEEYAITTWGDARRRELAEAISSGYPVIFGAHVDQACVDCTTWGPLRLDGDPLGGHAMVACGYDPDGVHALNSWGYEWGMGGLGLITWDAMASRARDLRVVTLVREVTS